MAMLVNSLFGIEFIVQPTPRIKATILATVLDDSERFGIGLQNLDQSRIQRGIQLIHILVVRVRGVLAYHVRGQLRVSEFCCPIQNLLSAVVGWGKVGLDFLLPSRPILVCSGKGIRHLSDLHIGSSVGGFLLGSQDLGVLGGRFRQALQHRVVLSLALLHLGGQRVGELPLCFLRLLQPHHQLHD